MKYLFLIFTVGPILTATAALIAAPLKGLENQLAAANSAHDRESAAEIYRRLYERKPKDLDILKGLIRAELNLGNIDDARTLIAKLEESATANDVSLLVLQGDLFQRDRKMGDAALAWQKALKEDPGNADVLAKLAMHFLYQEKNPATASMYFKKLMRLRNSAGDHIQVGRIAIAMRDWTVLIERTTVLKTKFAADKRAKAQVPAFERIINAVMQIAELDARGKSEADPVPVILKRGRLFLDNGFPELALNDARRALTLQPNALHVRLHYAAAAARLGVDFHKISGWGIDAYRYRKTAPGSKFLDRLAELDAVIFRDPDEIEALDDRAQLLYQFGEFKLAGTDARRLLNLDPDHVPALRVLALNAEKEGYFGKAMKLIDKANALAPDDLPVLDAASYIHSRQGNFERTIKLCDRWLAQSGDEEKARKRRQAALENLQKVAR